MTLFSSHLEWSAHSFSDVANYFLHVFFNPYTNTAEQIYLQLNYIQKNK